MPPTDFTTFENQIITCAAVLEFFFGSVSTCLESTERAPSSEGKLNYARTISFWLIREMYVEGGSGTMRIVCEGYDNRTAPDDKDTMATVILGNIVHLHLTYVLHADHLYADLVDTHLHPRGNI